MIQIVVDEKNSPFEIGKKNFPVNFFISYLAT